MDAAAWAAIGAIAMALINTTGTVLLTWIRARYNVHETPMGVGNGDHTVQSKSNGRKE